MKRLYIFSLLVFLCASCAPGRRQPRKDSKQPFAVIAYYSGNDSLIDSFPVEKLTHIIYSFCHLLGNRLQVSNAKDTATIRKLVSLKHDHPSLKIMLSLGGWGGCRDCSNVFAKRSGREEFAASVKELTDYFGTDGIDLDWEYPGIEGYPGHAYRPEDKANFTDLVALLRRKLGRYQDISFAAGGFDTFLEESVDWKQLAPLINRVNLMSYDLVNGGSSATGHHTPLFSTTEQKNSADHGVRYLRSIGFPVSKIAIGAAFYGRTWDSVENHNNGLYQSGAFRSFVPYSRFIKTITTDSGYVFFRDSVAKAPYAYNRDRRSFATFEDTISLRLKTEYAVREGLNGIMFWELTLDRTGQLLDAIDRARR